MQKPHSICIALDLTTIKFYTWKKSTLNSNPILRCSKFLILQADFNQTSIKQNFVVAFVMILQAPLNFHFIDKHRVQCNRPTSKCTNARALCKIHVEATKDFSHLCSCQKNSKTRKGRQVVTKLENRKVTNFFLIKFYFVNCVVIGVGKVRKMKMFKSFPFLQYGKNYFNKNMK